MTIEPSRPYQGATSDVLAAITNGNFPEGATAREIAAATGVSRTRAAEVLAALESAGTLRKEGGRYGRYVVAKEGAAAPNITKPSGPPRGWETPRVEHDGDAGFAFSGVTPEVDPDERTLFGIWKLDPEKWTIAGPLGVSAWQAFDGTWLYAYKAKIKRRTAADRLQQADVEDLIRLVRQRGKANVRVIEDEGDVNFAVFLSDWQIGKGEGGGTAATIARLDATLDRIVQRVKALRKSGRALDTCYIAGLGDIVENCTGFYPMQTFTTDLTRRAQMRVAIELLFKFVDELSRLFRRVIVATVGGNHGENRNNDGVAYTDFSDNDDVFVFEALAFALDKGGDRYAHVSFVIPHDELSLCLDMGPKVGITHGHLISRAKGGIPAVKAIEWWKGQMTGRKPVGDADILVSAHFHHFMCQPWGPRWHFQTPTMDGGSKWYDDVTGLGGAPQGTLVMTLNDTTWDGFALL